MAIIRDGTGTGNNAKVGTDGRLATRCVSIPESLDTALEGNAYNINSGIITLTDELQTPVLYFKNNEVMDFIVSTIIVGINVSAPTTPPIITITRNPVSGTIISNAVIAPHVGNRNFQTQNVLDADIFIGETGNTLIGGTIIAELFSSAERTVLPAETVMPRGTTIGISITTNDGAGGIIYAALVGSYLKGET